MIDGMDVVDKIAKVKTINQRAARRCAGRTGHDQDRPSESQELTASSIEKSFPGSST